MNQVMQFPHERPPRREETILSLLLLVASLLMLGPLVVFGAAWIATRWEGPVRSRGQLLWYGLGLAGVILFANLWPQIAIAYRDGFAGTTPEVALTGWLYVWGYAVLLLPAAATVYRFLRKLNDWLTPKTLQEDLAAQDAWFEERERKRAERAGLYLTETPQVPEKLIWLGATIRGESFPPGERIRKVGRWIALEESLIDQHLFVVGSTGAGKTEALKRLAAEILEHTDRDLFLVDGKGDPDLAQDIRNLAWLYDRGEAPIFRLGTGERGSRYDGFRGTPEAIYSRLVEMVGATTPKGQPEGDSEHYKAINRNLLQLVCYAERAGPPRSFEEVRRRLNLDWLKDAWQDNPDESEELRHYKVTDLSGLRNRLSPLVREFAPLIGPDGFALEETRAAVFSLRTQSVGDTASRLLKFLIEDLKDFAGNRQTRPAIFLIDEFAAFGTSGILQLLALARSSRLGIVLATQDIAGLGDETERRLILANTRTKLLMMTEFPEEVAGLAGTILQIESSIQHDKGEPTDKGSGRIQHAFRISMNEVPRLRAGEAFLIRSRRTAKLRIAPIAPLSQAPCEQLPPWKPQPEAPTPHDEPDAAEKDEIEDIGF